MPASGPTPGSTPTSVPTRQPMKPYQRTPGASATENPTARLWNVSSTSDAERAAGQRHPKERVEQEERSPRRREREAEADRDAPALHRDQQERQHDGDGESVPEAVQPPGGEGARGEDRHRVTPLGPAHLAEASRSASRHGERGAEAHEEQRQHHRRVRGARAMKRAERKRAALPHRGEADADE